MSMMQCYIAGSVIALILFASRIEALGPFDTGAGNTYKLQVTQDVCLERGSRNYNYLQYLIVGTHPYYPLKRSLLQFEDLPSTCTHVDWAKLYVYFAYAHKPSFLSVTQVPYISRPLQVYQVRQNWSESEATSTFRVSGQRWNQPWLALDGSDADPNGLLCYPVTIYTSRPAGFIEFDITEALRNWQSGDPNYGVLLLATNENALGRGIRFYSNARGNSQQHAFVNVLCD
ncbi:hypothetical protein GBAR_LOCUS10769 [Geodia barretti]|uniref:Uncharacterized protein n=1 Tax=Geodia barretti TaxID=519541 RepID=A0AA35RUB8_GEOBA|nr:hypothetical protein GBAR_LOCUS10769 [Geodia barretti]